MKGHAILQNPSYHTERWCESNLRDFCLLADIGKYLPNIADSFNPTFPELFLFCYFQC